MGRVSTSVHFMLELGCEDCIFLDQAVEEFEHGLGSNFMDAVNTPEVDASSE